MVMRWVLAVWLAATASAWAQSNPGFVKGQIPNANQWNSYFAGKADTNNGSVINLGMSGNTQLSGTVSGNPAFVGGPAFNGGMSLAGPLASSGGSLTGTFGGTPTFTGLLTSSGGLTVNSGSTITASGGSGTFTTANGLTRSFRYEVSNAGSAVSVNWTGSTSPTGFAGMRLSNNWSGTPTSGLVAANYIAINADTLDGTNASNSPNVLRIDHSFGGAAMKGGRIGILYSGSLTSTPGDLPANSPQYVAVGAFETSAVNAGGTGLTLVDSSGVEFAGYDQVVLNSGATNWRGIVGREIDVQLATGASAYSKYGLSLVLLQNDAVHAGGSTGFEMAVQIANQYAQTSGKGWLTAIGIGSKVGGFPLDPTGAVMEAFASSGTLLADRGIDLSAITFATAAFKSTGFVVNGSGVLTLSATGTALSVTNTAQAAAFKTSTALITAVDGGLTAAFTANMVGSTGGPTTAAQNGWVKMLDSSGATVWVPVWK